MLFVVTISFFAVTFVFFFFFGLKANQSLSGHLPEFSFSHAKHITLMWKCCFSIFRAKDRINVLKHRAVYSRNIVLSKGLIGRVQGCL